MNDPQHVIRVCHADLARLHEHAPYSTNPSRRVSAGWCDFCVGHWPCDEVRAIAAVYGVDPDGEP
jgi:hypothetical protein